MKYVVWYFVFIVLLSVFGSVATFNAHSQTVTQDDLDGEFQGLLTTFIYQDSVTSQLITQPLTIRLGRLKRTTPCKPFPSTATGSGSTIDQIPTASLAFEHWWLSFEMLMICQREYAVCVDRVKVEESRLGRCLIDDPACSPYAGLVFALRDYWVPPNVVFEYGIPTRETYIAHFEAGISGINAVHANIASCNSYLNSLKSVPTP